MGFQHLNSTRRRARKHQLALRDGQRCAYCALPFVSLREATLDHVVPVSLLRTWSAGALVLACRPCNHAKADRLPLSLALLIVWAYGPDLRDETRHAPRHTDPTGDLFTADRSEFTADSSVFTGGLGIDWRLLARLAHAHRAAVRAHPRTVTRTPTCTATRGPIRSGCDQRVRHARTPIRTATRTVVLPRLGDGRTTA
ncbi:HNH endonuclease [Streptomyces anulatus]|uniref:HNH endonuclease n=1 Tax=Streptomyces TaxID=1883 RepID=UPI0029BF6F69|nr:HNH endonuclease [Streptomyces sp. ID05-18]MDX3485545.1 HNH endonuclease domain-containing protein [Streptomyces sp. ID05-18]WSV77457.1 HNH endonuclease [Streptomyces anulatus]